MFIHMDKATESNFSYTPKQMKEMRGKQLKSPDLINGVLPSGAIRVLTGAPGAGKSFVALDWAMHIAAGIGWLRGNAQEPRTVVYIVGEGWSAFGDRIEQWEEYHGIEPSDHLFFIDGTANEIDMSVDGSEHDLAEKLKGMNPDLIIFDSFSMLALVDSYDKANISEVFSRARYLTRELDTSVLFTHYDDSLSGYGAKVIKVDDYEYPGAL